ncbi:MAG: hypothetical protein SFV19_00330 [Rhodospirillaceae bacterium]|nr:hypothetical protein [Rhodospirillaceae bacterium]
MRSLFTIMSAVLVLAGAAQAQEAVRQNSVDTAGAPAKTDAEPGYWTNLFENTMRFTVMHPAGKQVVDVFYNRDKTVGTNVGLAGTWTTEGEPGKEMFCYDLGAFKADPVTISECFPLRLMNNPRIGAKWGGKMKPNVNYLAEVVGGRPNAPAVTAGSTQAN